MNGNEPLSVEDLLLFALHLLNDEEAAVVREQVRTDPATAAELEQVRRDLGLYALAVEPVAVSAEARNRFTASLAAEPKTTQTPIRPASEIATVTPMTAAPAVAPLPRRGTAKVLPWLGWAAAAAAIVAALQLKGDRYHLREALITQQGHTATLEADAERARRVLGTLTDPSAVRVNLSVPKAVSTPAARATYEPKSGTLFLIASNLAPLQQQKVYELWLIPANGGSPIAAGTFSPDAHGNANLLLPKLEGAVAAKAFGITVEPTGGSPTPTLPILLAGAPA